MAKPDFNIPDGYVKMGANEAWDYNSNPVFKGTFLYSEENVGPNNSMMYTFRVDGGKMMGVWGSAILDTRLKNLQPGELVIIHYHGKKESEKRKGSSYHHFDVYHKMPDLEQDVKESIL